MADGPPIAELIRRQMALLGLTTQREVATMIGVEQSTVTRWMNGSKVSANNLAAVAKFLGITVDDLTRLSTPTDTAPTQVVTPVDQLLRTIAELTEAVRDLREAVDRRGLDAPKPRA